MVKSWRLTARAAALGEHGFDAGVGYGRLSEAQCMAVLKDAAEITRGLVGLDRRYEGIPGWERLKDQGRLGRAAEVCAAFAGYDEQDYSVDLRGWRPRRSVDHRPVLPGLPGIAQGEYNLLVKLQQFPEAHSMPRVGLPTDRLPRDRHPTPQHTDRALAAKWESRAEAYSALIQETRNVRGLLGNGGPAATQAAVVAARTQARS